jgi:hypothetical protein
MTDRAFERAVRDWLAAGTDRTPKPAIDAVLLAIRTTPQEREPGIPRRFTTMTSFLRLLAAAIAVVAVVGGGAIWYIGQSTHPSPEPSTRSPSPSLASDPTASPSRSEAPAPSGQVARGWPSTGTNPPGLYSWDGRRCAGQDCSQNFMHNGYGSGDVAITIAVLPESPVAAGATAVTVAGHSGLYRRSVGSEPPLAPFDMPRFEEWIVDIDGVWVAITLYAQPDTSDADLADAHAIIDSMRYEPSTGNPLGFRLVFRLTNAAWDSG